MKKLSLILFFSLWFAGAMAQAIKVQDTSKVFSEPIDTYPEYPGGIPALSAYLSANAHYPERAVKKRVQGTVFLSFIVEKDGTITDIGVTRHLFPELDSEAVNLMRKMPRWKPGTQNNQPCRVRYTLPVKFTLPSPK